jgi:hypothetical protein
MYHKYVGLVGKEEEGKIRIINDNYKLSWYLPRYHEMVDIRSTFKETSQDFTIMCLL